VEKISSSLSVFDCSFLVELNRILRSQGRDFLFSARLLASWLLVESIGLQSRYGGLGFLSGFLEHADRKTCLKVDHINLEQQIQQ